MRNIKLTPKQASDFWTPGVDITQFEALLNPGEVIIGIGSYGSADATEQHVLAVGTPEEKRANDLSLSEA